MFPEKVGRLRRALENAGALFLEIKSEVTNAAQVFEALAGRAAGYDAPRIVKTGAEVSASGKDDTLDHCLVHIELESGAFAEEVDLIEEGLHFLRGIGNQTQVIRLT